MAWGEAILTAKDAKDAKSAKELHGRPWAQAIFIFLASFAFFALLAVQNNPLIASIPRQANRMPQNQPALPRADLEFVLDLSINGRTHVLPDAVADPAMPLLWALRDGLDLTGTKFGCGVAACGACTVHVDGQAVRSCVTPLGSVVGKRIVTIEALGAPGQPHALQAAWIEHQVPQCGYCQSGMLMAAAALLAKHPNPSDADIDAGITNLCRCGTYPRIRAAIKTAADAMRAGAANALPAARRGKDAAASPRR